MRATFILVLLALSFGPAASFAAMPPPLVAGCTGCHAGDGDPRLPNLAGRSARDIVAAMKAFRSGSRPATIMDRIAKGFSDAEITAIATWYAAQR